MRGDSGFPVADEVDCAIRLLNIVAASDDVMMRLPTVLATNAPSSDATSGWAANSGMPPSAEATRPFNAPNMSAVPTPEAKPSLLATAAAKPLATLGIPELTCAIEEATIGAASIAEATFAEATIEEATIGEAAIVEATFAEATIEEATIGEAAIVEATFAEATIEEASIVEATIEEATIEEATLGQLAMADAILPAAASRMSSRPKRASSRGFSVDMLRPPFKGARCGAPCAA